jgi:hypothetical protein
MGIATTQAAGAEHTPVAWAITTDATTATINGIVYFKKGDVHLDSEVPDKVVVDTSGATLNFYTSDTYTINGTPYTPADAGALKTHLQATVFVDVYPALADILSNGNTLRENSQLDCNQKNFDIVNALWLSLTAQYGGSWVDAEFQGDSENSQLVINAYNGDNTVHTQLAISPTGISIDGQAGASGTFTSQDGKTVTVVKGLITGIV